MRQNISRFLPTGLALALSALGLAATTGASARGPVARFQVIDVRGEQRSVWAEPRHMTYSDCYHRFWRSGQGFENVSFRSRRPVKLLAYSPATLVFMRYGTWSQTDPRSLGGIPVRSSVERRGYWIDGHDPGDCGGTSSSEIDRGEDCGGVNHDWQASLDLSRRGRVTLELNTRTVNPLLRSDYDDCPLVTSLRAPVSIAQNQLTEIDTGLSFRDLFDPRRKRIVLRAARTFRDSERRSFGGILNMETTVDWQVTLVRVR